MVEIASLPPPRAAALAHRAWLPDGAMIDVRPMLPDDGDRLRRFHARLSPASVVSRYFHVMPFLSDAMVTAYTHIDYLDRMALVAAPCVGAPPVPSATAPCEIVSVVNYERISPDAAEVAFLVEDAWQGKGIATLLLYDLAAYALMCGFRYFLAITVHRNRRMLSTLARCGYPCTVHEMGDDEVDIWLDITTSPRCGFALAAH